MNTENFNILSSGLFYFIILVVFSCIGLSSKMLQILKKNKLKKKPLVYCVIGLISAGKSTTISNIVKYNLKGKKIIPIFEPVKKWIKNGLLHLLYLSFSKKHPEKYEPISFEMMAYTTRLDKIRKKINKNPDADIFIIDSHITIDRNVYTKKFLADGLITQDQLKFYDINYKNWKITNPMADPIKYIYIDTTVNECINRKEIRDRESERSSITPEYLSTLREYFLEFIQSGDISEKVICINGNKSQEDITTEIIQIIKNDLSSLNKEKSLFISK